ncbi:MAG TPA: family 1 glycosylhydrolase [Thermoanaerobaculia bacterium]|nr:family 1 glycosylhydrolase [Thermoanaerobaculia bacterium]
MAVRRGAKGERGVAAPLEMWGGVECTLNRVGDRFFDQLERNGHCHRLEDLDLFAGLGLSRLRYPVLWERVAPEGLARADWSWADRRMERMRELGLRPIVGLVHHGSGPRGTSLLDDSFVEGLAAFAGEAARRYPWVEDWTPVNEPLTTARFSGLYGFWYPHHRSLRSFVRALLVQCRATVAAMRAIRESVPGARLIQTEDFGSTSSTPALADQARYENHRRLLSLDLLCGRVDPRHPLWRHLLDEGAGEEALAGFLGTPPPDVIGINYYLTSDRLLDPRRERYPARYHGGNGRQAYADVEAVRAWRGGIAGHRALLAQLWRRYRRPLAITEVQAGATREEQLRWLREAWEAAGSARAAGIDVRAVTAWSLLGSWDWDKQVTSCDGSYESGVFDVRGGRPRPTAIAAMVRDLAAGRDHDHPVLAAPGWWRRPARFLFAPVGPRRRVEAAPPSAVPEPRPLLIAGAAGTLGRAFARFCEVRGLAHRLLGRQELDVADAASVEAALARFDPWAVVNAAGYVRVDDAERDAERCYRENLRGPVTLAAACRERGVRLLTFSSDLVFDGATRSPYVESDGVAPLGVYGLSKARAEAEVLRRFPGALVVRTSAFFGPWDEHNFLAAARRAVAGGRPFRAAADMVVSPTYVPDLVDASLDLLVDGESGLWHLANAGAWSWAEFARRAVALLGLDAGLVEPCSTAALRLAARRPPYSVLGSERAGLLPPVEDSLARWARDCAAA